MRKSVADVKEEFRMSKTLTAAAGLIFAALAAAPAWATGVLIPVPEPTTLSMIAVGTAAAVAAYRLRNRR